MRILLAPQALKGSLTAAQTVRALTEGVRTALPDAQVIELPIADGGEGTVEAMVAATGGTIIPATVTGPLGEPVAAFFGILGETGSTQKTAVIEMAAASGPYTSRFFRPPSSLCPCPCDVRLCAVAA